MTTLAEQLNAQHQAARSRRSSETLEIMDGAVTSLAKSGLVEKSLAAGSKAPDFQLPNTDGDLESLYEYLKDGPVVLTFYRGGWCPYCNLALRALQGALSEIESLGATLIAVSPQLPDNSLSTQEKLELSFPVLSDVGNKVAKEFGLVFTLPESLVDVYDKFKIDLVSTNGDETFELPMPGTYVIDRSGIVTWCFVDPDYTHRAEPSDIISSLREIAS